MSGQNLFQGEYVLVQYIAENYSFRSTMHYLITPEGDSVGSYLELFREEGQPDSGSFIYQQNPDRTFAILDTGGVLYGSIDDSGDIFSIVQPEEDSGYFGLGIRKSSGRSAADLSGEYWIAEFDSEEEDFFEETALSIVDFDGSGNATISRVASSVAFLDTFDFSYTVKDDGMINFDGIIDGILSPDGHVFVAGYSDFDSHVYLIGIQKAGGLDRNALNGYYNYTQFSAENNGWDDQSAFYGRLYFDGTGQAAITMAMGEAINDTFSYDISAAGALDADSTIGAVGIDSRYFITVDVLDSNNVSFGFGILGVDPAMAIADRPQVRQPSQFILEQNYPNPFNPRTVISWQLAVSSDIELNVYNLYGQKVATVFSGKQAAGSYQAQWNAENFASGIYFYTLRTSAGVVLTRRMLLLK